jgi:tetratricopeptide (TPR) repeat protein
MLQGIELVDWRNKDEVIKFYEANKLYFDNYQLQSQPDSVFSLIDIKISYCDALISKHHYTKCLPILTHINILINKLEKDKSEGYTSRHERYLFIEGIIFGYLKRYDESQSNFKELIKIDPDNDLYKDWYESNQIKIVSKISNIVAYAGFGIIMIYMVLELVFKIKLGLYVNLIGFIIMILGFSFPFIVSHLKRLL